MVDRACSIGWEKDKSNVDQMYCYLTNNPRRLCDSRERKALIATIEKFDKDYTVYNQRFMAATVGSIVKTQVASPQLAIETAKLTRMQNDPKSSPEAVMEQTAKIMEITGKVMAEPHAVMGEKRNSVLEYKLREELTNVISKGYISDSDFTKRKAPWVERAFKGVKSVTKSC